LLENAQALIQAATEEATKRGWHYDVAVVDSGANLVAFARPSTRPAPQRSIAARPKYSKMRFRNLISNI
jgi:uncharacterized protein GlcG (DUF336 family)